MKRLRVISDLTGILQGVGFRPTLARLAEASSLSGWVRNQAGTVRLAVEGPPATVESFLGELPDKLPPQARLDAIAEVERSVVADPDEDAVFQIMESSAEDAAKVSIPADLAMCEDCQSEISDLSSRYYGYPFTTCTNCGPRYTVVDGMPYDRERTALKHFPLCDECRQEYTTPSNRRFHAESIACPNCGPTLSLTDAQGQSISRTPLLEARRALADGKVVAVKGLGGFLLAVDAFNAEAVARLRDRKKRPHKPLAVMARDLETVRRFCQTTSATEELLESSTSPIVIFELRESAIANHVLPAEYLAPTSGTLGVMLPTTPLHYLLAHPMPDDPIPAFELLVMTSGNRGGEPICITNEEAFDRLTGIADLFLVHDRGINLRNDDSLFTVMDGKPQVWRRARGLAPGSTLVRRPLAEPVLGMGAELKNTVALGFENEVVVSPHIGDLSTPEAVDGMVEVSERFPEYFHQTPGRIAVDLHPDMHSTRLGRRLARETDATLVEIQHHHAHAAACMAEYGLDEALALVFDGMGLGTDGTIWGAELLHVDAAGFKRLGTFRDAPLPGGDAAVNHPVRQLIARRSEAGVEVSGAWMKALDVSELECDTWQRQCESGMNTARTHAAGRVFDAFSVLLGIAPSHVTYEGQAAIWMEAHARAARKNRARALPVPFETSIRDDMIVVDWRPAFRLFGSAPVTDEERDRYALGFHMSMAEAAWQMAEYGRARTGVSRLVLSGGVMMNRVLVEYLGRSLRICDFELFVPRQFPPNDGGVSLGQVVLAGGAL